MARIESQAVAGYYATPDHLLVPIAGMIMFPDPDRQTEPAHFHVLDPCAGEGRALYGLTAAWFGPTWPALAKFRKSEHTRTGMCSPTHVHLTGIEMEEGRFKALDKAGRILSEWSNLVLPVHGDALSVIWTGPGINLLYLNPPYEHDPVHGRMEHAFLLKFADTLTAGDGLLVFVVPFYALKASARLIAQKFEDVRCYRFGDEDFSAYKQVVLYARRRRFDLLEPDKDLERTIVGWSKAVDGMPVLGAEQGLYQVRVHTQGLGKVSLMPLNVNSCLDRWKAQTVGPTGYDQTADQMTMRVFPLGMRPREAHIAAAMGAGVFNGVRISANDGKGPDLLLKAVFTKDWLKTEEKKDKNGNVTAVVEQQQPKLNVVILRMDTSEFVILKNTDTPTGNSKIEDWSVADLLLNYGRSLVTAMDRTCPALHDPRRPREEIPLPPTVRTPFAAQREAIQAALKIAFTGESPYGLGEIGSGKTTLATVLLWALSTAHFEDTRRAVLMAERERRVNLGALAGAFPRVQKSAVRSVRAALVLCPPHLLKSWQDQIQSVIPGASVIVLNEPADLERVRESKDRPVLPVAKSKTSGKGKTLSLFDVQTDRRQVPAGPVPGQGLTIALLTRETAKLGHGYDHGYAHTRGGVHVACPSCGTLSESKVTLDAVKRRVRCEGRTARPNNGVALLMSEIAHGAASVVKGSTASAILGVSRFGRRLKNKRMPTVGQFFRLYAWAWAEHTRLRKAERKAQSVVFALFDLAMVVPMTPDESERAAVLIMIMAKSFFGDSSYNHGAELNLAKDLYLCRAAPFQSEADHARVWGMLDGHDYGRSNFLSMASVVRNAHLKIEALSPSGNAHGGNGFDARIKVTSAGEVLYEGRTIGAVDWIGKFLDDAHPASAWDVRGCYEFLYQAAGVRRFPLATLISQKHKDLFDFVIGDEFHEYNNDGTAQERAFHRLTALSATTMGLSGSLMAGYAKQLFRNLWAMSPRFRSEYKYTDMTRFCRQFGYYKRLIQVDDKKGQRTLDHGAVTDRVEKGMAEEKKLGDAPGFLPVGLIRFILPMAVTMQKSDMVEALPKVVARLVHVPVDEEVADQFLSLATAVKDEIKRNRYSPDMAGRLLGALAELPSFLDRAACGEFVVKYADEMKDRTGEVMNQAGQIVAKAPGVRSSLVLAKERAMLGIVQRELDQDRNVIVFAWHTELIARYERLCATVGETVVLMAEKVPTAKREQWIDREVVGKGKRILLVNPATVQTGLNNLVYFSSAIWMENAHCDPTITRQANGRIDRIGQEREVRIWDMVYSDALGMQSKCHDLLVAKIAVAQAIDGLDASAALAMAGGGTGAQAALAAQSLGKALFAYLDEQE